MEVNNLIIIGSGPAGYSAALYAAREDFKPLLVGGFQKGGQLTLTGVVENYPGFPEGIDGTTLMELFRKQSERFGAKIIDDDVTSVDLSKRPFEINVGETKNYSKSVIIATGASAMWLGLESEKRLTGKGVSSCATCDGPFFKNKDVVVVGGGDTAMEDSNFLTRFANSVTIVHRRNEFRASKIMQKKTLSNPKIRVIWDSVVEEVIGAEKVEGVKIKNLKTGETSMLKVGGVFVAIGHRPNTQFLNGQLKLDEKGYIITTDEVKTAIEGVFVAGDVADHKYRQAVTAASSGVKAALEARAYLNGASGSV